MLLVSWMMMMEIDSLSRGTMPSYIPDRPSSVVTCASPSPPTTTRYLIHDAVRTSRASAFKSPQPELILTREALAAQSAAVSALCWSKEGSFSPAEHFSPSPDGGGCYFKTQGWTR